MIISTITLTLNNRNFDLACDQGSKAGLRDLAAKVNNKITEIKNSNPKASYELLLVMTALSLQDQLETLKTEVTQSRGPGNIEAESEHIDTLNMVAEHLEDLAKKIEK